MENTPALGVAGHASRPAGWRVHIPGPAKLFDAFEVFRKGAENGARVGRAPVSILVFGLITQAEQKSPEAALK